MTIPTTIHAPHVELTSGLEADVRERVDRLTKYFPDLIRCDVFLEAPGAKHRDGGSHEVRLRLKVPREEIVVSRQQGVDFPSAIREAFDAARRRLEDYAKQLRA